MLERVFLMQSTRARGGMQCACIARPSRFLPPYSGWLATHDTYDSHHCISTRLSLLAMLAVSCKVPCGAADSCAVLLRKRSEAKTSVLAALHPPSSVASTDTVMTHDYFSGWKRE
jgi:hypothetical protein